MRVEGIFKLLWPTSPPGRRRCCVSFRCTKRGVAFCLTNGMSGWFVGGFISGSRLYSDYHVSSYGRFTWSTLRRSAWLSGDWHERKRSVSFNHNIHRSTPVRLRHHLNRPPPICQKTLSKNGNPSRSSLPLWRLPSLFPGISVLFGVYLCLLWDTVVWGGISVVFEEYLCFFWIFLPKSLDFLMESGYINFPWSLRHSSVGRVGGC